MKNYLIVTSLLVLSGCSTFDVPLIPWFWNYIFDDLKTLKIILLIHKFVFMFF